MLKKNKNKHKSIDEKNINQIFKQNQIFEKKKKSDFQICKGKGVFFFSEKKKHRFSKEKKTPNFLGLNKLTEKERDTSRKVGSSSSLFVVGIIPNKTLV